MREQDGNCRVGQDMPRPSAEDQLAQAALRIGALDQRVGPGHRRLLEECRAELGDLESAGGAFQSSCQKASASSSMIGLLPDVIARTREEVCGSKRRM